MTNGKLTSSTFGQLYFEGKTEGASNNDSTCFDALKDRAVSRSGIDIYGNDPEAVK